jgi:hypothetical protein
VIAGAANEIAVMANAVTQMTQDLRLSTVGTGAAEAILEETLVLADMIEVPKLVASILPADVIDKARYGHGS